MNAYVMQKNIYFFQKMYYIVIGENVFNSLAHLVAEKRQFYLNGDFVLSIFLLGIIFGGRYSSTDRSYLSFEKVFRLIPFLSFEHL